MYTILLRDALTNQPIRGTNLTAQVHLGQYGGQFSISSQIQYENQVDLDIPSAGGAPVQMLVSVIGWASKSVLVEDGLSLTVELQPDNGVGHWPYSVEVVRQDGAVLVPIPGVSVRLPYSNSPEYGVTNNDGKLLFMRQANDWTVPAWFTKSGYVEQQYTLNPGASDVVILEQTGGGGNGGCGNGTLPGTVSVWWEGTLVTQAFRDLHPGEFWDVLHWIGTNHRWPLDPDGVTTICFGPPYSQDPYSGYTLEWEHEPPATPGNNGAEGVGTFKGTVRLAAAGTHLDLHYGCAEGYTWNPTTHTCDPPVDPPPGGEDGCPCGVRESSIHGLYDVDEEPGPFEPELPNPEAAFSDDGWVSDWFPGSDELLSLNPKGAAKVPFLSYGDPFTGRALWKIEAAEGQDGTAQVSDVGLLSLNDQVMGRMLRDVLDRQAQEADYLNRLQIALFERMEMLFQAVQLIAEATYGKGALDRIKIRRNKTDA